MKKRVFTAGFMFCGLGAGARGFLDAQANLGHSTARFHSVGGIDNDSAACRDFERLTGSPATCADISTMAPAELRAAWGEKSPDVVFLSAPCKGFSSLLGKESAKKEKYQKLNRLALQGLWLLCEAWSADPPGLLVFENVPRIRSRGAWLLDQIRQVLTQYGYRLHEDSHDCGEIGGLAQHRQRYLMVARRPDRVREFVYQPPKKRVRGVGEVLGPLPLPGDPSAGPLHRVPQLKWVNWVRLALIKAGGDWRDLPRAGETIDLAAADEAFQQFCDFAASEAASDVVADSRVAASTWPGKHPGKYGVREWGSAGRVVTGETDIQEGAQSVADPRIEEAARYSHAHRVTPWGASAGTVTHSPAPSSGAIAAADPRIPLDHEPRRGSFGVIAPEEPTGAVRGVCKPQNGGAAIADSRIPPGQTAVNATAWKGRPGFIGVGDWGKAAPAVTATMEVSGGHGQAAVADPRLPVTCKEESDVYRTSGQYGVLAFGEPSGAVTASLQVDAGRAAVADERLVSVVQPGEQRREHFARHGVLAWGFPAPVVAGSGSNGASNVADPRSIIGPRYLIMSLRQALELLAQDWEPPKATIPVIVSADATWHRPLTTLELAVLQGISHVLNGEPLTLSATTDARRREHIGNAVPVQAGEAIGRSMLEALLAHSLGWFWSREGLIWVAPIEHLDPSLSDSSVEQVWRGTAQ